LIASLTFLLQAVAAPGGQASAPQVGPPVSCRTSEVAPADPALGGAILYIGCGGAAVRIGKVDSYRSSYNPGTRSLAVVIREGDRTRVLVAQPEADGTLQLQDLSRDLARASGRPFDAGLRAVEVDLERFAKDGSIATPALGRPGSEGRLPASHYALTAQGGPHAQSETPPAGSAQ
jgi:hypothetical protein